MQNELTYVFMLPEEQFACLVRIEGMFDAVELDFENGEPPIRLEPVQLATPGTAVEVPDDSRKLHVQLLRANVVGTKGPLLMWLGQKRLLAVPEEGDGKKAQLVTLSDPSAFQKPNGQLDTALARADARAVVELAKRVQAGFAPGEVE